MGVQKKLKVDPSVAASAKAEAGNEDEIDQIMNEIELLQQKMDDVSKPASAPVQSSARPVQLKAVPAPQQEAQSEEPQEEVMAEFRGSSDDASMEETLAALKDDSEGAREPSLLDQAIIEETTDEESADFSETDTDTETEDRTETETETEEEDMSHHDQNSGDGCLTMTLNGNMTLKLKYEVGGQEVTIGFSNQTLKVQLADGTEFKIPVGKKTTMKKVA